jgi:hypothetical protein
LQVPRKGAASGCTVEENGFHDQVSSRVTLIVCHVQLVTQSQPNKKRAPRVDATPVLAILS